MSRYVRIPYDFSTLRRNAASESDGDLVDEHGSTVRTKFQIHRKSSLYSEHCIDDGRYHCIFISYRIDDDYSRMAVESRMELRSLRLLTINDIFFLLAEDNRSGRVGEKTTVRSRYHERAGLQHEYGPQFLLRLSAIDSTESRHL